MHHDPIPTPNDAYGYDEPPISTVGSVDAHLHVGSLERIADLRRYVDLLGLRHVAILSLPLTGLPQVDEPECAKAPREGPSSSKASAPAAIFADGRDISFNPEVLAAACSLGGCAVAYGSFDDRALIAEAASSSSGPPGPATSADAVWRPARQVEAMAEAGFFGIKMWEGKPDLTARLGITLDDPRLIDAYVAAGEYGMPVLIHVADPRLFWKRHGGPWSYVGRDVPSFDDLLAQAGRVCRAARRTTFIFPHLLFLADDLPRLRRFLDDHDNALMDLAPGNYLYPALGGDRTVRRAARSLFREYRRRIMVGSDAFFLPETWSVLPGTPLTDNMERLLRLHRFLFSDVPIVSPFPLTAEESPLVRGLAVDDDVYEPVSGGVFRGLLERRGVVTPDPTAVLRYLRGWGVGSRRAEHRAAAAWAWIQREGFP